MRHRFHAICPYFAMFPESFVEEWVEKLTKPGEIVADPFCGRGSAPFQALLMGRRALANDINPVAYCVTKAKTQAPPLGWAIRRLDALRQGFRPTKWDAERMRLPPFFAHAYSKDTLRQILYLRHNLRWRSSTADCMLAAVALGALHGDTKGPYFSNQMPRTISTKPAYSIRYWEERDLTPPERDVFNILERMLKFRYVTPPPMGRGLVYNGDMRELPKRKSKLPGPIKFAITSPPYFDTTRFEEDQWLRLWFLGGAAHPTYGVVSRDDRYDNSQRYWELIHDTWLSLGAMMDEGANVVMRLAVKGMKSSEIAERLEASALNVGRDIQLRSWSSSRMKRRQTNSFRPGSIGVRVEVDCLFRIS